MKILSVKYFYSIATFRRQTALPAALLDEMASFTAFAISIAGMTFSEVRLFSRYCLIFNRAGLRILLSG